MEPNDVPDVNATVLFVGNLDKRVTDQMMLNILRSGLSHIKDKILSANMYSGTDMTNPENSCYVQFADNSAANQALNFLSGRDFCGKKVKVSWATNNSSSGVPKVIGTSVSIYVGNLDESINEKDLRIAFEPFGEILNVKIVRDPITNRSKSIAFISYTNKQDAEKAIREMYDAVLKGRGIKTNWATRNSTQKKPEEQDYDTVYKATPEENQTIYVGGIPSHATDEMIRDHFKPYGRIDELRIFGIKNYAFVKFESHQAAATAICKTNGSDISGSVLKVWWGKDADASSSENSHNNRSSANHSDQQMNQQSPYAQQFNPAAMAGGGGVFMNPQQTQQQYMQYMQYYQYWMQHYNQMQMQMQQQQGANNYQQHQQTYQNYQQPQQQQYQGQSPASSVNDEKPAQ